ncbi:MAG: hypothetical protein ACOYMN_05680 [Roseimicrobium sp.]
MSITLEANKGLRLKLGRFSPIRTWHGGAHFWSHEFQLTVRQGALAAFLPRAVEDEDSVLFEHRSGGAELASTSVAITNISEVPARELNALRDAVNELKRKAEDPHCDRTKRLMIEGFRLPDPQRDRDLYRLIGKGSSAKLIVLWGVEREEGSALAPGAAVDLLHTPRAEEQAVAPKKSKLLPALICLALLAAGGWYFWQQEQAKQQAAALAAQHANAERIAAFNAAATQATTPAEGTVMSDDTGTVIGVVDKDGTVIPAAPGTALDKDGKVTEAKPGTVLLDDKGTVKGVVDETGKIAAATPGKTIVAEAGKPVKAAPGTVVKDGEGKVTGIVGKDGKVVTATPGLKTDKDGKATSGTPGTVFRDDQGRVTGVAAKNGQIVPAKPGAISSATESKSTTAASTPGKPSATTPGSGTSSSSNTFLGTGGKAGPGTPGSVVRDHAGLVTGVHDKDGKIIPATPGKVVDDKDGKLITGAPGSVVRNGAGVVTGVTGADGKLVSATPGTVTDKDGKITAGPPGTVFRDHAGVVTGVAGGDGKVVPVTPGAVVGDVLANGSPNATPTMPATPSASASVSTPMTTKGPPPAGISSLNIVSTSLSGVLANGNVEVLLNVVARDAAGAVVNAPPINGWKVNGSLQNKPDGTPADGPALPVSLPPGQHSISTVGQGGDGQPFQTDAEVTIAPKQ